MEARNIPPHGTVYRINEILDMTSAECDGKSVRVTGRVCSRDFALCTATIADKRSKDFKELLVDTELISPFPALVGSLVQFIGELEVRDKGVVLRARVVRNVDGLDMPLYYKVLEMQRDYLSSAR